MRLLLCLLLLLTLGAFWLAWNNRESEKITSAVVPILTAAIVGVALSVFAFGGQSNIDITFPAAFYFHASDKMPMRLTNVLESRRFPPMLFAVPKLKEASPSLFDAGTVSDDTHDGTTRLYHHLLQKSIIDWIGLVYRQTWDVDTQRFEIPDSRMETYSPAGNGLAPSETYSTEEIEKLLDGNIFAKIHAGIPPKVPLPPGSALRIIPPRDDKNASVGEIEIRNKFFDINIRSTWTALMNGAGSYSMLAGLSDKENRDIYSALYMVHVTVHFSRLYGGSPQMRVYRRWAEQMTSGLTNQFDEERIWSLTKEDYLFYQQATRLGPIQAVNRSP